MENNIEIYGNIIDVAKVEAFQEAFRKSPLIFLDLTKHAVREFNTKERPLSVISKELEKLYKLHQYLNILFSNFNEANQPSETTKPVQVKEKELFYNNFLNYNLRKNAEEIIKDISKLNFHYKLKDGKTMEQNYMLLDLLRLRVNLLFEYEQPSETTNQ